MNGTSPSDPAPVRIAITCGDPAGIGTEVALKALNEGLTDGVTPCLVGPRDVWERSRALWAPAMDPDRWPLVEPDPSPVLDWSWGKPTPLCGEIASRAVEEAVRMALRGEVDAVVTAPLTKEGLRRAGRPFLGHTEFLAHLCGEGHAAIMLLAGAKLRVFLVTTHVALRQVPRAVTRDRVLHTIRTAHEGLISDLGVSGPRIAVAALNPHGGEGGILGTEERRAIGPAVEAARREGIDVVGPHPADSLFFRAATGQFDAVVAMYHDQGLVPLKLLHFHDGVNVTLGLPIIRTSPDHGTAFDIAGRGVARSDSFREAVRWAADIARRRRSQGKRNAPDARP